MGLVMRKILVFFLLLVSVSFSSDFDKKVNYLKGRFSNLSSEKVVDFLCEYTKTYKPFHKFLKSEGFGYYTYTCKKDIYTINLKPYYDDINISNYKRLVKFVENTKTDLKRLVCKDPVFKAALYSNIRVQFKIHDSKDGLQETLTFNRNVTPACGLIR